MEELKITFSTAILRSEDATMESVHMVAVPTHYVGAFGGKANKNKQMVVPRGWHCSKLGRMQKALCRTVSLWNIIVTFDNGSEGGRTFSLSNA
ncbi:hypothetical protein VNO77_25582 [Canavalia gladiata]|uniref:Uncharacterized protein n=1 Tax=Canavalia gladiata TaxID=3824 RepID=A0AAN9LBS2_CANGL